MASESLQVRRRPTRARLGDSQRNSNVVRASVLETALELGFGQNSTVADWIFNNPVSEEPEDLRPEPVNETKFETQSEPVLDVMEDVTPTFTSGSNSMSDESSSLNSPANNAPSAATATIQVHTHTPSLAESPHVHFSDFSSDQLQLFSPFALSPHGTHHAPNKGLPIGRLHKDMERPRSQDDSLRRDPIHESPEPAYGDSGYTSEGQYLSKVKASKGKDKSKGKKASRPKTPDKSGEKDGDYTSDGGYLSASSNKSLGKSPGKVKSRAIAFFRRRPKRSASDDDDETGIPPVPALPNFPRPSSPRLLERRAAPSSPTRSGFSPLSLNLTNPPASPSRRRVSKSPPPARTRTTPPQRPDHLSAPQRPTSPVVTSISTPVLLTPAATLPLPPSVPSTPLSTASFPTTSVPSTRHAPGTGSISRPLTASSSRQHLSIPPPAPPPTLPLPQPPPSPPTLTNGPLLAAPTPQSWRGSPGRPIPVTPTTPGSTQPLTPRRTASPFRPILSPRSASESSQLSGKGVAAKRPGTMHSGGLGSTPAFLQRKIQHGPPPSPRRPPPDVPLPPSPFLAASTRPRTPILSPSKFHEHLSSVSSLPLSEVLSAPMTKSPSPSTATLSGSSSGPSVRSSHISSVSERNEELAIRDPSNRLENFRPKTSASSVSESGYSQPTSSTFGRPAMDFQSHISDRSDNSSSVYSPPMHRDSSSITTYDVDDTDIDDATPKSFVDVEDDDASLYPSDDKTAGRRTMYLLEHGELDESGDEIVINGSRYWNNSEVPPPVPPLPLMPTRPGPGYF